MFIDRLEQKLKIGDILLIGDTYWIEFGVVCAIREKSFSIMEVKDQHVWEIIDGKHTLIKTPGFTSSRKSFNISNRCLILNDTMLAGLADQEYATELKRVQEKILLNV